jgi:hypothetical protein
MAQGVTDMKAKTTKVMKFACLACAFMYTASTWANSNFVSNPDLPYPPSCAWVPTSHANAAADLGAVLFQETTVQLPDHKTFEQVEFVLRAYRSPCSEPGRSLVWLEYSISAEQALKDIRVTLPAVVADHQGSTFAFTSLLNQAAEPNSWGAGSWLDRERFLLVSRPHGLLYSDEEKHLEGIGRSWWFLLDIESPLNEDGSASPGSIPAAAYNARFKLRLTYPYNQTLLQFEVPATAEMDFPIQPTLPFTGRLSGNWVIEGTSDQGLMLAISGWATKPPQYESVFPPLRMVLFYSHYTFDAQGDMLWLTGSAEFEPGTHQVTIPIDEVTQGQFRSSQPAERRSIGHVTLSSNNCNDITMEYDYNKLGLGSGTKRLQRLISLETAGYDCRDYAARVEANQ